MWTRLSALNLGRVWPRTAQPAPGPPAAAAAASEPRQSEPAPHAATPRSSPEEVAGYLLHGTSTEALLVSNLKEAGVHDPQATARTLQSHLEAVVADLDMFLSDVNDTSDLKADGFQEGEPLNAFCSKRFKNRAPRQRMCEQAFHALMQASTQPAVNKAVVKTLNQVFANHASLEVRRPQVLLAVQVALYAAATYLHSNPARLSTGFKMRSLLTEALQTMKSITVGPWMGAEMQHLHSMVVEAISLLLDGDFSSLVNLVVAQAALGAPLSWTLKRGVSAFHATLQEVAEILLDSPAVNSLLLVSSSVAPILKDAVRDPHENRLFRSMIGGLMPGFEQAAQDLQVYAHALPMAPQKLHDLQALLNTVLSKSWVLPAIVRTYVAPRLVPAQRASLRPFKSSMSERDTAEQLFDKRAEALELARARLERPEAEHAAIRERMQQMSNVLNRMRFDLDCSRRTDSPVCEDLAREQRENVQQFAKLETQCKGKADAEVDACVGLESEAPSSLIVAFSEAERALESRKKAACEQCSPSPGGGCAQCAQLQRELTDLAVQKRRAQESETLLDKYRTLSAETDGACREKDLDCQAVRHYVSMHEPAWVAEVARLRAALQSIAQATPS